MHATGLKSCLLAAVAALPFVTSATVPSRTFAECQRKTANPLDGCPDGTIYVSHCDSRASFKSIQAAIRSLPNDTSAQTILIGPGTYYEQLNVTRSGPLALLGMSNWPSRGRSYSNITSDGEAHNDVQIYFNDGAGDLFEFFRSRFSGPKPTSCSPQELDSAIAEKKIVGFRQVVYWSPGSGAGM